MRRMLRAAVLCLAVLAVVPGVTLGAGVEALFDLSSPTTAPFPSDAFTKLDLSHLTLRRVNLPKPDCAVRVSDCQDIDVINTLDGFNLQPRFSIPFSGAIAPSTVDSSTVYLVNLGDTTRVFQGFGKKVGINQVVWDPAKNTLHVESDEVLKEHTKYALVVNDRVKDANGDPVEAGDFGRCRKLLNFGQTRDPQLKVYRAELILALLFAGVPQHRIVAASIFTTQSATAVLEKIRKQIEEGRPAPANLELGTNGERTVFPPTTVSGIVFARQVGTTPLVFSNVNVPVAALFALGVPGPVSAIAFGSYASPDYETADKFIPPVGTR